MTSKVFFGKHDDNRGSHMKFFTSATAHNVGFNDVHEVFMTTNNRYTLRGLHRQGGKHPQQKIVKPVNGRFNLRVVFPIAETGKPSSERDEYTSCTVTDDYVIEEYNNITADHAPIYVPKGALLGYVALRPHSKMLYIADNDFNADDDEGYNAFSPLFHINWGVGKNNVIMNDKDKKAHNYTLD